MGCSGHFVFNAYHNSFSYFPVLFQRGEKERQLSSFLFGSRQEAEGPAAKDEGVELDSGTEQHICFVIIHFLFRVGLNRPFFHWIYSVLEYITTFSRLLEGVWLRGVILSCD